MLRFPMVRSEPMSNANLRAPSPHGNTVKEDLAGIEYIHHLQENLVVNRWLSGQQQIHRRPRGETRTVAGQRVAGILEERASVVYEYTKLVAARVDIVETDCSYQFRMIRRRFTIEGHIWRVI